MTITYTDFEKTTLENLGEVLVTSGGHAGFRLGRTKNVLVFTPVKSGNPRKVSAAKVQRYLDIFNKTQSTKTTDYSADLQDSSYVLALLKLHIAQRPHTSLEEDIPATQAIPDVGFTAPEGNLKLRSHLVRERNPKLINIAKDVFKATHKGRLFCEACDFDFGLTYGEPDFIEAHHRVPLCDLEPGSMTKVSDLVMVCANCHRMLHRGNVWPTINELRKTIDSLRKPSPGKPHSQPGHG